MRLFQNLPIGVKIAVGTSILCALLLAAGIGAGVRLIGVAHHISTIAFTEMTRRDDVVQLASQIAKSHQNLSRYVIWSADREGVEVLNKQSAEVLKSISNVKDALGLLDERLQNSNSETRLLSDIKSRWEQYSRSATDILKLAAVDPTIGTMMLDGTDDAFRGIDVQTEALMRLVREQAASALREEIAEAFRTNQAEAISVLLALILSTLITWIVSRSIAKPIEAITRAMSQVSLGFSENMAAHTSRADEIGEMARAISRFQSTLAADRSALVEQNLRLEAVVSNIPHGIALYDADERLIVNNKQHAKLYHLPSWDVGTPHPEILAQKVRSGVFADPEYAFATTVEMLKSALGKDVSLPLSDGRTIALSYSRIPGGGWVETHKDATARRQAEAKIAHIAHHDALTHFPNRRFFNERLSEELDLVAHGKRIAIHSLDLNGFKKINDRLGHSAGDHLLVQVAQRLRSCLNETDFCARLGGDEFVIIQSKLKADQDPRTLATRLIESIGRPYALEFGNVIVEASIGIAMAPQHGLEFDLLMRNVDSALYHAKKELRPTFRYFDEALELTSQRRRRLEDKLRETLDRNALILNYQPMFDTATAALTGFEALCRWSDPEDGDIPPSEFIPIAEETGLIQRLGKFVLDQACLEAANWPRPVAIAVNVSPLQFRCGNLAEQIRNALSESGLEPSRLEIEVTETTLLNATEDIQSAIRDIKSSGVRIVMDDFGKGYSGLSYLGAFKFDKLKIDHGLVRKLQHEKNYRAIVKAVVGLCKVLGVATIAEGVETLEDLALIQEAGCAEAQGYLFSPALRSHELQRIFEADRSLFTKAALSGVAA